ncbi:hypothetical protein ACFQFC_29250 [Amorphoplanes digitatis]|uniref:Uncharacterized protein n=1 Tax=Actinoplanes digitatis TaxID=1868 RepID=A0A7W7MN68_9ACTN|nr:hypothetical protein [Actinoplanes digitatis]MBB4760235.1 hypothetical protein [Actinoplanes digitatis]GID94753.1 hypothetical protein Adi01nite_41650 [Actinoplanes digitatis]
MTTSGLRVTPVRRTVAIAVALVTGQALLCGVIGVVTFGEPGDTKTGARAAGPEFRGPPAVAPTASVPPAVAGPSAKHSTRRPEAAPTRTASRPPPPAETPGPPARPALPQTAIALPPAPPDTGTPSSALVPPPAPPPAPPADGEETQAPVRVWDRCDEEGAAGLTADGRAVRCLRGRHGDLRWRLV